jgi:hypothetical protein
MSTALPDPVRAVHRDRPLPLPDRRDGKVRVSWALRRRRRLIVTTDRLSAFDRVIAGVPYKGQVLNQLSGGGSSTAATSSPTTRSRCPTRTC